MQVTGLKLYIMRDRLVSSKDYFEKYFDFNKSLTYACEKNIKQGLIPIERYYISENLIFQHNLELLIAQFSSGEEFSVLIDQCTHCIDKLSVGWDDRLTKFRKGKPSVTYNHYYNNQYYYMMWPVSYTHLTLPTKA